MAEGNAETQASIVDVGGVPRLIALLGRHTRAVHRDASGVLWSLAELERNRRVITDAGGINGIAYPFNQPFFDKVLKPAGNGVKTVSFQFFTEIHVKIGDIRVSFERQTLDRHCL